jgi:hypothetical protein
LTKKGSPPIGSHGKRGARHRSDASDALGLFAIPATMFLETYARAMSHLAGSGTDGQSDHSGHGEPVSLEAAAVEAASIASGSSMRYAQQMTEVMVRHEGLLMNAAAARFGGTMKASKFRHAEVEQFRQFLREVSQIAISEAHRLEHELELLGEAVAQDIGPPGSKEFRRFWEAKR